MHDRRWPAQHPGAVAWTAADPDPRLRVLVNARAAYWASTAPIPGGAAFENFELVEPFRQGREFRFRIEPVQGDEILPPEDAAKRDPNFLMGEIGPRIAKEPAKFRVLAQLAQAGDPTNDATKPWPDDRKTVDLCTLTVSKAVPDSAEAEKALLFMPNNLTDGIEVSDDPLIDARVQAYAVSFSRRSQ